MNNLRIEEKIQQYESISRGLNKKIVPLAKASLAVGATLIASIPAVEATPNYSGIQNIGVTWPGGGANDEENIDLDMDGAPDVFFRAYGFAAAGAFVMRKVNGGAMTAFTGNTAGGFAYPVPRTTAHVFDTGNAWVNNINQGSMQIPNYGGPQWASLPDGAVRVTGIRLSGNRHGWIRIRKNNSDSWTIIDWDYEDTANAPISAASVLPVELGSFTATAKTKAVRLDWTTFTEQNNAGFDIERSLDGQTFETIAFVEGKGTTTEKQTYYYDDKAVRLGKTYYYRLKQIDFDGASAYSDLASVTLAGQSKPESIFSPNPSNGQVVLSYDAIQSAELQLAVFDLSGRLLIEKRQLVVAGYNEMSFDFSELTTGVYAVKLTAGDSTEYQQLVIK